MNQLPQVQADIDNTKTWVKYNKKMCSLCRASCCSMPVEVQAEDLVRMQLVDEFELQENLKVVAKRLIKDKVVEHFHSKTETFTIVRMASGDCMFLDTRTRQCTMYDVRPDTCRNHPQIGPRSGYCAFKRK